MHIMYACAYVVSLWVQLYNQECMLQFTEMGQTFDIVLVSFVLFC